MLSPNLFLIALSTLVWYWASSSSAVASQQTVALCSRSACEPLLIMLSLHCCQIFLGAIFSLTILFLVSPSTFTWHTPQRRADVLLGTLHFVGFGLTNVGYAFGSASLVQTVKMLEPIETLMLTAFVNLAYGRLSGVTRRMIVATLLIVSGTILMLSQKKAMKPNPMSIVAALGSGVIMSSRNVVKKAVAAQVPPVDKHNDPEMPKMDILSPTPVGMKQKFIKGISSFADMSVAASFWALLCLLPLLAMSDTSIIATTPATMAAVTNAVYNSASLVVLSLVSAPTHSLLNAGKRISNVLVAAFIFSVPLGNGGKCGMLLASIGALTYAGLPWKHLRWAVVAALGGVVLIEGTTSLYEQGLLLQEHMMKEAANLLHHDETTA